jgi:ADP-heptose:LPS heptosyltransferase
LALLCRRAGFRHVLGFADGNNPWLTNAVPFDLRLHRMERQAQLLRRLGVNATARRMRMVLSSREQAFGESVWCKMPTSRLRLVLAPGGGKNRWSEMPNRRWPIDNFVWIARRAIEAGFAVQWAGGPEDRALIQHAVGTGGGADGFEIWTVREMSAVIATAHLVVSNDSLPLFLSAALHTPVVGLYGPTDSHLIHPPGSGPALQGPVACGPCYLPMDGTRGMAYRCPRARCMEALSPEFVWSEIQRWVLLPDTCKLA